MSDQTNPPNIVTSTASSGAAEALPRHLQPLRRLARSITVGRLDLTLPDGRTVHVETGAPGPNAKLVLHRWRTIRRGALRGDVGLGEAYMDGDWDSPDLVTALQFFAANTVASGASFGARGLSAWLLRLGHAMRRNTKGTAKRNIAAHYDLGNDFYATWLDPSMTYSSALFERGANDLESAQADKYRALIQRTGIKSGEHVLEIGCGWGGFAELAAKEVGCRVTAITLSRAQRAFAQARVAARGLSDRVDVVEIDYRDVKGPFDRVVSIEMIEAVGERYWPVYFAKIANLLKPGGTFGLQAITIGDQYFETYRRGADFLKTYIFPGGMLLPERGLLQLGRDAGLVPNMPFAFGSDYARTLNAWRERFQSAWPRITGREFDERFGKMWHFYLASCEAGFRSGLVNVCQVVFERPDGATRLGGQTTPT